MSAEAQAKAGVAAPTAVQPQARAGVGTTTGGGRTAAIVAIAQRELASLFYQPIAYVVGLIFLAVTGFFFMTETLVAGQEASLRPLMELMAKLLVFTMPMLTMRSISDDLANGTIETLMTSPVTDAAVVLGKFFGTLLFYVALLATTLLHVILMAGFAHPAGSLIFGGYVGMVLLGGLFIAVGIFASSCTRHQLLAAILGITILAIFTFLVDFGAEFAGYAWMRNACARINFLWHFEEFTRGIIEFKSVVFFLSGIIFFLFLATKVMESRRWR